MRERGEGMREGRGKRGRRNTGGREEGETMNYDG